MVIVGVLRYICLATFTVESIQPCLIVLCLVIFMWRVTIYAIRILDGAFGIHAI